MPNSVAVALRLPLLRTKAARMCSRSTSVEGGGRGRFDGVMGGGGAVAVGRGNFFEALAGRGRGPARARSRWAGLVRNSTTSGEMAFLAAL